MYLNAHTHTVHTELASFFFSPFYKNQTMTGSSEPFGLRNDSRVQVCFLLLFFFCQFLFRTSWSCFMFILCPVRLGEVYLKMAISLSKLCEYYLMFFLIYFFNLFFIFIIIIIIIIIIFIIIIFIIIIILHCVICISNT